MYKERRVIQSSEIGFNNKVRIKDLADIIQDLEGNNIDGFKLLKNESILNKVAIFLNFRYFHIKKWPVYKDNLEIETITFDTKAFMGYRNTLIKNSLNELMVETYCVGSFINMETLRPYRLSDEIINEIGNHEKHDMTYMGRKINLDIEKELIKEDKTKVSLSQLDYYNHLNNAIYIEIAFNEIPRKFDFNEVICEYKLAFELDDEIILKTYKTQKGYQVIFYNKEEVICSIIEFNLKES